MTKVDEALQVIGTGQFQYRQLATAGAARFADGVEDSLLAILSASASCAFNATPFQRSFLIAAVLASMTVLGPVWGLLSDLAGIRSMLRVLGALGAVTNLATAFSPSMSRLQGVG